MDKVKAIRVDAESVEFENGITLTSYHGQDCCERHYLSFADLTIDDFSGILFDLSGESFFNRIKDYGIELVPIHGHSIKVPGYGYNNGCYSSDLDLMLSDNKGFEKYFCITECQVWMG
jgi:hypothetical protein